MCTLYWECFLCYTSDSPFHRHNIFTTVELLYSYSCCPLYQKMFLPHKLGVYENIHYFTNGPQSSSAAKRSTTFTIYANFENARCFLCSDVSWSSPSIYLFCYSKVAEKIHPFISLMLIVLLFHPLLKLLIYLDGSYFKTTCAYCLLPSNASPWFLITNWKSCFNLVAVLYVIYVSVSFHKGIKMRLLPGCQHFSTQRCCRAAFEYLSSVAQHQLFGLSLQWMASYHVSSVSQ